jgi:DNA-binding MarR family transcriptional regulator
MIRETNDLLGRIDLLFSSMMGRFISIPARQPATDELSMARMRVLLILGHRETVTPSELARILGIANPTATELAAELVNDGFVRRQPSPRDRRQVHLSLLPAGKRLLAEFARRRREKFARLLRTVEPADARRLAAALEVVNDVLAKGSP